MPQLGPESLANRFIGYIVTIILTAYVKADLEKKLQEAVKRQQRFVWSVLDKRGKVLMQRYYPDTNKKVTAVLPIAWLPNQELNLLNALQKINDVMKNSGCNLK